MSDTVAFNRQGGGSVLAMIASARNSVWPLDIPIADLDAAVLPSALVVRMKLFTLDHQLVIRKAGRLARRDRGKVAASLRKLFKAKD